MSRARTRDLCHAAETFLARFAAEPDSLVLKVRQRKAAETERPTILYFSAAQKQNAHSKWAFCLFNNDLLGRWKFGCASKI
jgi:hypothetical protein